MPIVSSQIADISDEGNGLIHVVERHLDHNGREYMINYDAVADFDTAAVLAMRAENLGAEIDRREAERQEALNFSIPLAKDEFRSLYTAEEQAAVSYFYATYLQNPNLSDELKAQITAGIDYYKDVKNVHLNHPLTIAAVNMHETLGLIGTGRAAEILGG